LQSLIPQQPQSSVLPECLGFIAYRADRSHDALHYFTAALMNGSRNTDMVLLYAHLASAEGIAWNIVLRWIDVAAQWQPSTQDILFLQGQVAAQAGAYDLALRA